MHQPPGNAVPFVLCIDVEPDGQPTDRAPLAVAGANRLAAWLEAFRAPLEDRSGTAFPVAWFIRFDAEIAERGGRPTALVELVGALLERAEAHGDSFGTHSHVSRWDQDDDAWVVDSGNAAFVDDVLRSGFEAFQATFGRPCRIHRFGDRWWSDRALDTVAALGARIDLTLEPGQRGIARADPTRAATGPIPDALHERSVARRWRSTGLVQLPLSSADPAPAMPLARRLARRVRYAFEPRHRTLLLDRAWPDPAAFWSVTRGMLAGQTHPYVAVALRSDTALESRFAGVQSILSEMPGEILPGRRLAFATPETTVATVLGGAAASAAVGQERDELERDAIESARLTSD